MMSDNDHRAGGTVPGTNVPESAATTAEATSAPYDPTEAASHAGRRREAGPRAAGGRGTRPAVPQRAHP